MLSSGESARKCIFVKQRYEKVYYILRHKKYSEFPGIKMKILTKLRRLETEIPKLKGKKREVAMETYRELLWLVKDEPIYLIRYE